ncbi:MAG: DUF4097 domain-containing protein [Lachnospiraceae bacterium]|jgi:hypothetical protein|nr:DUF4097 domain-containing protein [Lachnospiraceae bacterium]
MRRGMKVLLIVGLIFILLGGGLYLVIHTVFRTTLEESLPISGPFSFLRNFVRIDGDLFDIEEKTFYSDKQSVLSGDVDTMQIQTGTVINLAIDVGGANLRIKDSQDGSFWLKTDDVDEYQVYEEDGTFYLKSITTNVFNVIDRGGYIDLYIPLEYEYEEIDLSIGAVNAQVESLRAENITLNVGAGNMELNLLSGEKIEIKVGAGNMSVADIDVKELNAKVDAGNLDIVAAKINEEATLQCNVGNLDLQLQSEVNDYNFDLDIAMGKITIDGKEYNAIARSQEIDHDSHKDIKLKVNVGSIHVTFASPTHHS